MLRYLIHRLWYSILVLWGVATLVFLLFYVVPGRAVRYISVGYVDTVPTANVHKAQPRDKSLWLDYGHYLNDLSPIGVIAQIGGSKYAAGIRLMQISDTKYLFLKAPDLGRPHQAGKSVGAVLAQAWPRTFITATAALFVALIIGIGLGILAATRKGTIWDTGTLAASVAGLSIPTFFAALLVAYASGHILRGFTAQGINDSLYGVGSTAVQKWERAQLILPVLVLILRPMAMLTLHIRNCMLDVLAQNYIKAAYARGLRKTRVVFGHALPNALAAAIATSPDWLAELMAGAFLVEYVFGLSGIGRKAIDTLPNLDIPIVIGATLLAALLFVALKFVMDVLRAFLDPGLRISGSPA